MRAAREGLATTQTYVRFAQPPVSEQCLIVANNAEHVDRRGGFVSVVESLLSDIIDTKTKRMTRVIRSTL